MLRTGTHAALRAARARSGEPAADEVGGARTRSRRPSPRRFAQRPAHRRPRSEKQEAIYSMVPRLKAVHWEPGDGPTECVALLTQSFRAQDWHGLFRIPSYIEWFHACDMQPAYDYHRLSLQVLQSRAPGRWSLKAPGHLLALDALLATYPDARLVVLHRDPVEDGAVEREPLGHLAARLARRDRARASTATSARCGSTCSARWWTGCVEYRDRQRRRRLPRPPLPRPRRAIRSAPSAASTRTSARRSTPRRRRRCGATSPRTRRASTARTSTRSPTSDSTRARSATASPRYCERFERARREA